MLQKYLDLTEKNEIGKNKIMIQVDEIFKTDANIIDKIKSHLKKYNEIYDNNIYDDIMEICSQNSLLKDKLFKN